MSIESDRVLALLKAINDSSFYNDLSNNDMDMVEQINAKSPDERTADDARYLSAKLYELASMP